MVATQPGCQVPSARVARPGLDNNASVAGSTSFARDESLALHLESLSKRAPQFLFRVWSAVSGGCPALNTIKAITPAAFLRRDHPVSIHDIPRDQLADLLRHHILNHRQGDVRTVFSSWSQSLPMVLSWARLRVARGEPNVHISVLETKHLPPTNAVLHAPALLFLAPEMPLAKCYYEFLIFGPISGPSHKAVPFAAIVHAGIKRLGPPDMTWPYYCPQKLFTGPSNALAKDGPIAQKVASLFGARFALAITVYIVTMAGRDMLALAGITEALASCPVPVEWRDDAAIEPGEVELGGVREAARAVFVLHMLVERAYG
ncbi:hypothetical protein LTR08_008054 [Meristemomyces frigidus]|nr:hypothetical protein LTR08_008054 [Meristemomyces frigidus]